jgi:hypothetical protein
MAKMGKPRGNYQKFNAIYNEELVPSKNKEHIYERDGHIIIGHPDMIEQCRRCGEWKNQTHFSPESMIDKYGRKKLRTICMQCSTIDSSLHYHLRKVHSVRPADCEFCKRPPKNNKRVQMDIDHTTNKFRGWLCNDHNTAFGKFKDDPFEMIKGIKYLITDHHDKNKLKEELLQLAADLINEDLNDKN